MKVIWTKEKLKDVDSVNLKDDSQFSIALGNLGKPASIFGIIVTYHQNSMTNHARASGDGASAAGRCCRLCSGDRTLRRIKDTCLWEGVEERYDHLLADCFGVKVTPSDSMICDRCIGQLRNTQRFRALVHAAFEKSTSEDFSNSRVGSLARLEEGRRSEGRSRHTLGRVSTKHSMEHTSLRDILNQPDGLQNIIKDTANRVDMNKKILEVLRKRSKVNNQRKQVQRVRKKRSPNSVDVVKRTIAICNVCSQRYPMITPTEDAKHFVCSRCKMQKNSNEGQTKLKSICRKCDIVAPENSMRERVAHHSKADLRRKSRTSSLPKKPSQSKKADGSVHSLRSRQSYTCSWCNRNCLNPRLLADHIRSVHADDLDSQCPVCGKDCKSRYLLEHHMKLHTGEAVYKCDICKRMYKGKHALQLHYLTHESFTK